MIVHKFGGTSVGSAERFAATADIIENNPDPERVVVVSAMSGTTNALLKGARDAAQGNKVWERIQYELLEKHMAVIDTLISEQHAAEVTQAVQDRLVEYGRLCESIETLGELTRRGSDAVASLGERMSACILAAVLGSRNISAQAVSATQCIRTDNEFGEAIPDMEITRQLARDTLLPIVAGGNVAVVTGFIGATEAGITTTLGRGGSDYSAAILGASLDADEVLIWTDVKGILTADPRLVPDAHILRCLSYQEAEELAYFGASVLHPKTVAPLAKADIPFRILSSFEPHDPGTLISKTPDANRQAYPAIISTEDLVLLGINGNGRGWTLNMASRALRCLADRSIDVLMFSQSFSEQSLNLVVRSSDQVHSVHSLEREFEQEIALGHVTSIASQQKVATVSVVGMPDSVYSHVGPKAFAALAALEIPVISLGQASSAYSVSFVIPEDRVVQAVPYIHQQLGL